MSPAEARLSGIFIYPVKSLRGIAIASADVDAFGLVGDRRFMVVDELGDFLTQRTLPRMALVTTALDSDVLTLSATGRADLHVRRASDPSAPLRRVTVWRHDDLAAEDCGDAAAAWLSDFLAVPCRLVRLGREYERANLKPAARPGDAVSFADSCPFLLLGESSLEDLNDRLIGRGGEPVPMERFRPNLVVSGAPPYAEDGWGRFHIGGIAFRSAGPCARCVVTTTDQATARRGVEPLRTLATYRRDAADPTAVNFGENLIHETKAGRLKIGDSLHLLP